VLKKIIKKETILLLILLLGAYAFLYQILIPRVSSFGCFDDCFNIVGGYFILNGLHPYSDFFFNHQMLMPYISYFIQLISDPINIFDLVLKHRQTLLFFSFFFNAFLILRFRLAGFLFVLFYEFSKYYIFGDRFLAESFIVYPLVYMIGILIFKFHGREVHRFEYFLSAIFAWLVVFMREPYTPLAFLLLLMIHIPTPRKIALVSAGIFLSLSAIVILQYPISEYYFNVVTVSKQTVLSYELKETSLFGAGFLKAFLYPLYVFMTGEWNIFRSYLLVISLSFLLAFSYYSYRVRNAKLFIAILLLLGLANLRLVAPGTIFYEAFHIIPWFGMIIMSIFLVLSLIKSKPISYVLYIFLFITFLGFIFSEKSYLRDKVDQQSLLINNYSREMGAGQAVKNLSKEGDTFFADGFDELTFWQSGLLSPYRYGWYTSVMPRFEKYRKARVEMFEKNPPDFYYGSCEKGFPVIPGPIRDDYVRLTSNGKPGCIFVHVKKLPEINDDQWKKAGESLYELPEDY